MMRSKLVLAAALSCAATSQVFATGADQFRAVGVMAFDRVVDAAAVNDRIYALGKGTLTIYNANIPGFGFGRLETMTVGKEFVELEASSDELILCSRLGAIELYTRDDDRVTLASRFQAPDSILAAALFQDKLCLAHGYTGVSVYDIADPTQPILRARLLESAYASGVDLTVSCLYVLDRLNGVQVYDLGTEPPRYLAEIPGGSPVLDLAADREGVAVCDGSSTIAYWRCDIQSGVTLDNDYSFEFRVTSLAADPLRSYRVLVGSEMGDLALYDREAEIVIAQTSVATPVAQLLVADGVATFPYVAISRTGDLVALAGIDPFVSRREIQPGNRPISVAATRDGALVSTARGLELLSVQGGDVVSDLLAPAVPIYTFLEVSDDVIVGANAAKSSVQLFHRTARGVDFSDEVQTNLNLVDVRVSRRDDGSVGLYMFARNYVMEIKLDPDGTTAPDYSYVWPVDISAAAVSSTLLMGASEDGRLVVYEKAYSESHLLLEAQIASRPRDLEIIDDSILAVASSLGLDMYLIDRGERRLIPLNSPSGIYSPFDTEYDEEAKELLVADGLSGVKYFDLSHPTSPTLIYSVANTEGATTIAQFGAGLYCLSADWLKIFQRVERPASSAANRGNIATVEVFPNPFNAGTEITLKLNADSPLPTVVNLALVNILGQTVAEKELTVTTEQVKISLADLMGGRIACASGIYLLSAKSSGRPVTRKLVLLK